jgi:hypothetical protein
LSCGSQKRERWLIQMELWGTNQKQTANKTDVTRPGKRTKSDIENGHRKS